MPDLTVTTLQCPICEEGTTLVAVERSGVLIDACPRCRGVWLDRGELDKLIELEAEADSGGFLDEIRGASRERESSSRGHHGSGQSSSGKKRKRGGLLGEMFDIG